MKEKISANEYLIFMKKSRTVYNAFIKEIASKQNLTIQESYVLLFFSNNLCYDAAIDAVKIRGMSKAYVSKAIELLVEKDFIRLETDDIDRRYQHIKITNKATETVLLLQKTQQKFFKLLTDGISDEDKLLILAHMKKMSLNIDNIQIKKG